LGIELKQIFEVLPAEALAEDLVDPIEFETRLRLEARHSLGRLNRQRAPE
jgi:hypothetical protein